MKPKIDLGLVLLVGVVTVLIASVGGVLAQQQNPVGQAVTAIWPRPRTWPLPTPLITPTRLGGPWPDELATPASGESAAVVGVNERSVAAVAQPTLTPSFRNYDSELAGGGFQRVLYVTDPTTGESLRLGEDGDRATLGAMTDEFVIWYTTRAAVQRGLHLYWFGTKQGIWITDPGALVPGEVQLGGRWVVYMDHNPDRSGYQMNRSGYQANLSAYNVDTSQTVTISDDAFSPGPGMQSYLTINEDMVAWVGNGATPADRTLNVYDLRQGKKWQVPTHPSNPPRLKVSRTAVVWWDEYWKGYDLANEALFTVPLLPPGVDRAAATGGSVISLHSNTLEWEVEINGQIRHFTGTLTEKGPSASASAQSFNATAIPALDMTATPPATPLPTDTPLPPPTDTAVPFATATALPAATAIPSMSRLSVSPAQQAVQVGQTLTVALQLNADRASRAVQVAASFNPTVIHCDTASEGDLFQGWAASRGGGRLYFPMPSLDNSAGQMSDLGLALIPTETVPVNATPGPDYYPPDATFTRLGGVRGLGTLVTLHCTALAAGVSPITVSGVKLYNDYANPGRLEVALDNGQVFVGVTPTPVH